MITKRILIFAPLLLTLILLQSYFWVPTYEQQAKSNPDRLNQYINASIGDAAILNPILSADSASSEIEGRVFEGLLDRDENLNFRGRLAKSWKIYEEAYFYINTAAEIPNRGHLTPEATVELLQNYKQKQNLSTPTLKKTLDNIQSISLIAPRTYTATRSKKTSAGDNKKDEIEISVAAPARVKLVLEEVDQNLFANLKVLLGDPYFSSFDARQFLTTQSPIEEDLLALYAAELLPATAHHPIIVFNLRENVKFHDGHIFDAQDVKFTYEAIMDPGNLSPRISDYEPVKKV